MSAIPSRMVTRITNIAKHPGEQQNRYNRKTPQEAQAERKKKEVEKQEKQKIMEAGAKKAADVEKKAQQKAKSQKNEAGVLTKTQKMIPRAYRPRAEVAGNANVDGYVERDDTIEVGDGLSDWDIEDLDRVASITTKVVGEKNKHLDEQSIYNEVDQFGDETPAKRGASEESMSSGSDFEPAEESERGFDDVELEDDEPDTELANKKSSGKKEKKGVLARNRVRTIRDQLPDWQHEDNDQTPSRVKRKLDTDLFPHTYNKAANIKKLKRTIPSGVKSNWDKDDVMIPPAFSITHRTASLSSAASNAGGRYSASSPSVTTQSHSRSETSKPASVQPGGISSGEDEVEHRYVVNQTAVGMRYRSIAKIEEIEGASILTKRSNVKKSVRPTLKNLPSETTNGFNNFILYKAYNKVGELDAWATLPDDKIAELWNEVFGDIYPIAIGADAGDDNHLFTVIKKLISRGISSRISNRLGEAAVMALEDEYNRHEIFTVEDRAGFVTNMLGNDNETNRPFLWQTTDDVKWQGARENFQGLFLGRLVLKTLAVFVNLITSVRYDIANFTPSEKPRGALMLSIQAVLCALTYSTTGKFQPPSGKTGSFSQENWGDYTIQDGKGKGKLKRRSTLYQKRVDKMTEDHWKAVMEGVAVFIAKRKAPMKQEESVEVEMDEEEEEEALYNPMFQF
ncbi:hypothetical protein BYT27DRAFT_7249489 [Phlegmacium glaucopus]|nr:hypothetical protein BYT27DRAFT_7249489 [Phlegmacium glaucopus]